MKSGFAVTLKHMEGVNNNVLESNLHNRDLAFTAFDHVLKLSKLFSYVILISQNGTEVE